MTANINFVSSCISKLETSSTFAISMVWAQFSYITTIDDPKIKNVIDFVSVKLSFSISLIIRKSNFQSDC